MRGAVAPVSKPPITLPAGERALPGVRAHVALEHVLVREVAAAVSALVHVVAAVHVHVHPDVVSAGVHLVADEADVAATRVRQSVDHELLLHLVRRGLPRQVQRGRRPLLLLLLLWLLSR